MFFRALVILSFSLLVVACGLNFGEQAIPDKSLQITNSSCLEKLSERVDAYLNANITDSELREIFSCVGEALNRFEKRTEGANKSYYLPSEIKKFAKTYYFPDKDINDNLVSHLMNLKVGLVAGDKEKITRKEFRNIIGWVKVFENFAVNIRNIVPVITAKSENIDGSQEYELASNKLYEELKAVTQRLNNMGGPFELSSINGLAVEFRKFAGWDEAQQTTAAVSDFIIAFRQFVLGSDNKLALPSEWPQLSKLSVEWLRIWLSYSYKVKSQDVFYGKGLRSFIQFMEKVNNQLKLAVNNHRGSIIPYEKFYNLIDSLSQLTYLPEYIRAESLKSIIKPFFGKILGDINIDPDLRAQKGLSLSTLSQMETEFYKWSEVQKFIEAKFNIKLSKSKSLVAMNNKTVQVEQLRQAQSEIDISDVIFCDEGSATHYREFCYLIKNIKPFYRTNDPRVIIATDNYRKKTKLVNNIYQLSMMNTFRVVVRLVIRGYSASPQRTQKLYGLKEAEVESFISDFTDLFEDINIVPPQAEDIGKKIFFESNMFTFSADGMNEDDGESPIRHLLSFREGIEYFAYLYSTFTISTKIYESMLEICTLGPKDIYGFSMIYDGCFRSNIREQLMRYIGNLPAMKVFVKVIGEETHVEEQKNVVENLELPWVGAVEADIRPQKKEPTWPLFEDQLLAGVVKPHEDKQWVGKVHIGKMVMILHYIETLMVKFDADNNGFVSEKESVASYPQFEGMIRKMIKQTEPDEEPSEELKKDIFNFILKYGSIPSSDWKYLVWTYIKMKWPKAIEINRLKTLEIFSRIMQLGEEEKEEAGWFGQFVSKMKSYWDSIEIFKKEKSADEFPQEDIDRGPIDSEAS